jgi:hypothetical protein
MSMRELIKAGALAMLLGVWGERVENGDGAASLILGVAWLLLLVCFVTEV